MASAATLQRLEVEVRADTDQAESALRRLGASSSGGGGWASSLAAGATRAFAVVGAAAAAGGAAIGAFGLRAASDAQQASIAFESLLGSGEKARSFLGELRTFAANTPFEFPELRDAASKFLAVGVEANRIVPLLRAIGDSTAAMGTGAYGIDRAVYALQQMASSGRVTKDEMNQLADAGVPMWEALAEVLKTDVKGAMDEVSNGTVTAETLFRALETSAGGALKRTAGMMDKQSASLAGLVSTLKDAVTENLATMFGPAVKAISAEMPMLTKVIEGALGDIGPHVTSFVGEAVGLLADLVPQIAPILGTVMGAVAEAFSALRPALATVGPALLDLFRSLAPVAPALAGSFANLAIAAAPLIRAFAGIVAALPPSVLAALVTGFIAFRQVSGPLQSLASRLDLAKTAASGFSGAMKLIGVSSPWMLALTALAAIATVVIANWSPISGFFVTLWGTVTAAFSAAWAAISGFVTTIGGLLAGLVSQLIAWPQTVIGVFAGAASWLIGAGTAMISGLWSGVTSGIARGWHNLTGFGAKVIGALAAAGGWLVSTGAAILRGLWSGVTSGIASGWHNLTGLAGRVKGALAGAAGWLVGAGRAIIQGLWNGIAAMGGWLKGKVAGFLKGALGVVGKILDFGSPSRVFMQYGIWTAQGLAEGMLAGTKEVHRAAASLAGATALDGLAAPALTFATGAPALVAPTSGRSRRDGGGTSVTVLVEGSVVTERELTDLVRRELIRTGVRTGGGILGGLG